MDFLWTPLPLLSLSPLALIIEKYVYLTTKWWNLLYLPPRTNCYSSLGNSYLQKWFTCLCTNLHALYYGDIPLKMFFKTSDMETEVIRFLLNYKVNCLREMLPQKHVKDFYSIRHFYLGCKVIRKGGQRSIICVQMESDAKKKKKKKVKEESS